MSMSSDRISILCVDDHPLFQSGIRYLMDSRADMHLIAVASTAAEGIALARQHRPDVILMDLRLPDMSGISAIVSIREDRPDARILMLTTFEGDVEVQRALAAGAHAYMLKSSSPEELVSAIQHVHAGKKYLPPQLAVELAQHVGEVVTAREVSVLKLIAAGNRNKDIAEKLCIAEDTVKGHIKNIMEKLGARDRTQAVAIALQRGIIEL
jgi:DNA-binding NarL/FixJ family response regulator